MASTESLGVEYNGGQKGLYMGSSRVDGAKDVSCMLAHELVLTVLLDWTGEHEDYTPKHDAKTSSEGNRPGGMNLGQCVYV